MECRSGIKTAFRFKEGHCDQPLILFCVRCCLAYRLSLLDLEEMVAARHREPRSDP